MRNKKNLLPILIIFFNTILFGQNNLDFDKIRTFDFPVKNYGVTTIHKNELDDIKNEFEGEQNDDLYKKVVAKIKEWNSNIKTSKNLYQENLSKMNSLIERKNKWAGDGLHWYENSKDIKIDIKRYEDKAFTHIYNYNRMEYEIEYLEYKFDKSKIADFDIYGRAIEKIGICKINNNNEPSKEVKYLFNEFKLNFKPINEDDVVLFFNKRKKGEFRNPVFFVNNDTLFVESFRFRTQVMKFYKNKDKLILSHKMKSKWSKSEWEIDSIKDNAKYKNSIYNNPDYIKGDELYKKKMYKQALPYFEKLYSQNKENYRIKSKLAIIYGNLGYEKKYLELKRKRN